MRAPLCFYQFWGLFFNCCGVPNSQKQWVSSLTPTIAPLSSSSNIPWLVSMAEICQGIILSRWWILSTVSCLNKLKPFHSDISGVINQESILLGHKICLHPGFNPQDGTVPVKGDIGVVLLQYPIMREEIPLSHTYTIFWKSCYNCLYRHCRVYQYQKYNNFGTIIRKLSFKLLDLSYCHHQHIHMAKNNNLCIWSQPQEDCLIQQGSPVLCLFGIRWELVGLVSESSTTCYDPILVIKTVPYLAWMRWFINHKSLDPIFFILCSFLPGVERDPQDKLSTKKGSAVLLFHGFSVQSWRQRILLSPLHRQRRNSPLIYVGSKNRDSFLGSIQLYLQSSQISLSRKFPMARSWISPTANMWDPSDIADLRDTRIPDTSESLVISGVQIPRRADIPLELANIDARNYQYGTLTDLITPWVKLLDGVTGFHTLPSIYAGRPWNPFSSEIDAPQVLSEINAAYSHFTFSSVPIDSQLVYRHWLETAPDFGPWAYFVPEKTERKTWYQYSKESIRIQIYHLTKTVSTGANPGTHMWYSWVSLLVNKIELQTYSMLGEYGSQYSVLIHTFQPWIQSSLDIYGPPEPIEKTRSWIVPESISKISSSAFSIPFSEDTSRSLMLNKDSQIRPSSKIDRFILLNKHKSTILEHHVNTHSQTWLLIHPITNVIDHFIHSEVNVNRPWNHHVSDTIETWNLSETQLGNSLIQLKADIITLWLQSTLKKIRPWIQPYFKISNLQTKIEEGKNKHSKTDTIRLWTQSEIEAVISWNQPESDTIKPGFLSRYDHMKFRTQPDFNSFQMTYPEVDIFRPWIQNDVESIQSQRTSETFTFGPWIQSKVNTIIPKTKPELFSEVLVRMWFQTQTTAIIKWSKLQSQTDISWVETKTNGVITWYHTQIDTLNTWIETKFQKMHPLSQPKDAVARTWTQTKDVNVRLWFQTPMETVSQWTIIQTEHNWTQSESEIVKPWIQPVANKVITWLQHKGDSVWSWNKLEGDKVSLWTQSEVGTLKPWFHEEFEIIKPWIENKPKTFLKDWIKYESPEINSWKQSKIDMVTLWTQNEMPIVNHWTDILTAIVTPRINTEFQGPKSWTPSKGDQGTIWTQIVSPIINALILSETDTFTTRTQSETFSEWILDPPTLHQQTENIDAIEELWSEDELPSINTLKESIVGSIASSVHGNPVATVPWIKPLSHKILPWTQSVYKIEQPWSDVTAPTIMEWFNSDSPLAKLWEKAISNKNVSPLSKDEYPAGDIWPVPLPDTVRSPWLLSEYSPVNIWPLDDYPAMNLWSGTLTDSIIPPWPQAEYSVANLWPKTLSDAIILPWQHAEHPPVIQGTQPVPGTIIPLRLHAEYPQEYLWIKSVSEILTPLWMQAESSTVNLWPHSLFDFISSHWDHVESSSVKFWKLLISNTITLQFPQLEIPGINLWTLPVSEIPIPPWPQVEYPPANIWTLPASDTNTSPWSQAEYLPFNQWTLFISSEVIPNWLQDESPLVDITIPLWPQDQYSSKYLLKWTFSKTDIPSKFQSESSAVNLWTQTISNTFVLPLPQVEYPLVTLWTLPLPDTIMPLLPQSEYLPVNQWAQFISDDIRPHWLLDESSKVSLIKLSVSDITTPLWPQDESPSVFLWTWTVSKTVTPSVIQDESSAKNLWTQLVSDTIIPPWLQAEYPLVTIWTLPFLDAVISPLSHIEYPIDSLWILNLSNTISWPQSEFSPGHLWPLSLSDTITPLWLQSESPAEILWTQTLSDKIMSSRSQIEYEANAWTLLISDTIILPWPKFEYPLVNLWTLSVSDAVTSQRLQTEYKTFSLWTMLTFDTATPLESQDESSSLSLWKMPISGIVVSPWLQAEYSQVNPWAWSLSYTITASWPQAEFPGVNLWPQTLSESNTIIIPKDQAESQVNLSALLVSDTIILPWLEPEDPLINLWTSSILDTITPLWLQSEYPSVSFRTPLWSQYESAPGNLWSQLFSDMISATWFQHESLPVNLSLQSIFNAIIPPMPQVESPAGKLWVQSVSDIVVSLGTQAGSIIGSLCPMNDTITPLWPKDDSATGNLWGDHVPDAVILPWLQAEFAARNLQSQPLSDITILPWSQNESPPVNLWTLPVVETIPPWLEDESLTENLWSESEPDTVTLQWSQGRSLGVSVTTESMYVTTTPLWLQGELPAIHPWIQPVSDTILPDWLHVEFPIVSLWILNLSDIDTPTWMQAESLIGNLWSQSLSDIVTSLWLQTESLPVSLWTLLEYDTIIPPWSQTKFPPINLWPELASYMITSPWPLDESLAINTWTLSEFETIMAPWLQKESPLVNKWTVSSTIISPWLQGESSVVNPRLLFASETNIVPWAQVEYSVLNSLTEFIADTSIPETQSKILIADHGIQSFSDVLKLWLQTESPSVRHWAQAIFDPIIPWNQATLTITYLWTMYDIDTFKKWITADFPNIKLPTQPISDILNEVETEGLIPWTKIETDIFSYLTLANSEIIDSMTRAINDRDTLLSESFSVNPETQLESDVITMWIQTQSPALITWTQTKTDTITLFSGALLSTVNSSTVIITGTEKSWKMTEVKSRKDLEKSATEIVTQRTQNMSTAMNVSNTVTLLTQDVSSLNYSTQFESHKMTPWAHKMIPWAQVKSLKKYALIEDDSETVTPWNQGEFSGIKTLSEAGTLILWQHTISKTVIPRIDTTGNIVNPWQQTQFSALIPWTQFIANTTWIKTESPTVNSTLQPLFDKITLKTRSEFPLVNTQSQEEKTEVNSRMLSKSPKVNIHTESQIISLTPWLKAKTDRITLWFPEDHLIQPVSEIVELCIESESTIVNSFLQKGNTIVACSQTEFSKIYPWKRAKVLKVMPWTQVESLPVNLWTEAKLSKYILWSQVKSPSPNSWKGATTSKGMPWTQAESSQEDSGKGARVPRVFTWIQTENSPPNPWVVAIDSKVINRSQTEFPTLDPWIHHMTHRATLTAKVIDSVGNNWAQTSSIILGKHSESIVLITQAQTVSETFTALSHDESPILNSWAQSLSDNFTTWTQIKSASEKPSPEPISYRVTPWTQGEFSVLTLWTKNSILAITELRLNDSLAVLPRSDSAPSIITIGSQIESPKVKTWSETVVSIVTDTGISYAQTENDIGIFSRMLAKESKKPWTLSEVNILGISMHPQTDATQLLNHNEKYASLLWTYPETENVTTWSLPKFRTVLSWIVSIPQVGTHWYQPESFISRLRFKIQRENIRPSTQSDFQILSNFTSFRASNVEPRAQHKTVIIISWIQSETGVFDHWIQSKADMVRSWTVSESDRVIPWIYNKVGMVTIWMQTTMNTVRPVTQYESQLVRLWTQTVADVVTLLSQTEMQAAKLLPMSDINTGINWYQTQNDVIKQSTKIESQMVNSWIQPELQVVHPWNQPKINAVRSWSHLEGYATQPWIPTDTNTVRLWTYSETDKIQFWTHPELQTFRIWPEVEILTILSLTQYDEIRPLSHLESQIVHSWDQTEVGLTKPLTQDEASIIRQWTESDTSEILPWTQSDKLTAYFFQSHKDSIRNQNQPESKVAQTTTITNLININTMKYWTQGNVTSPWIQINSLKMTLWNKSDTVKRQTQQRDTINYPGIYQSFMPWDNLQDDKIRSRFNIQMNKGKSWTFSESQQFSPLIQPEIDMKLFWKQPKTQTVKPWTHSETDIVGSWSQVAYDIIKPGTSLGERTLILLIHSETQKDRTWTQPETGLSFFAITKDDKIRTRVHPETTVLRSGTYKADEIESLISPEIEQDQETLLTGYFGIWSKIVPFLPVETIPSLDGYFVALSNKIAAIESQDKSSFPQPSHLTNIVLLTLSSNWLLGRFGFQNFGSNLQIITTKGNLDVLASSISSLSPAFIYCSLPSSCTLSSSCSFFTSCTFPSSCIFSNCSLFSPVAFSPLSLLSVLSDSLVQELSSSKFTEESIISHNFSSLPATPATLLTKQSRLMPESQSEPLSKHQPEQVPFTNSELNISLAECRLGVIWKDNVQALWLFKTAIVSHETTECGLRHGHVPRCPNCWEAEMGEFPWMVSVQLSFSHFCAGSILNKQWILTSARCANFIKNAEALALVQVGLIDLQDPAQAQTVRIHHAMPYLGPKGPLGPGLIFLKEPLNFEPMALPICLEESLEQEKNIQLYDCWLSSWSLMRGSPGILQKRHLSILKVSTCAPFWPKLNEFTFCVEAKKAMGEAGCKGDLGAPLVCHLQQKKTWVQVGILIHFDKHCTKPYVFSQVSPFIFWLQGVTRPSLAPWSQQGPMTTSASISLSVFTSRNASVFTSTTASVQPHFISLPQPQTLAERISLRYTMPWQAMIISCGTQICSGSIISSSWVLTAAHCVRNMNPEDTVVILGLRYPGAPLKVVKVSNVLLHEKFRLLSGVARNDLALLLLQETPTSIQILAPLGNLKNLNSSECWLSGPRVLTSGETDENPEVLQMQVMETSNCAYLYPDLGSSIICFITHSKGPDITMDPVSPGSAVICRPISGNGKWRQIGFTSLKSLATIVSPHLSWILTTSAKAGHPLNQEIIPWVEKPKSSCLFKQTTTLPLFLAMIIIVQRFL